MKQRSIDDLIETIEREFYSFDVLQLVAVIEELLEDMGGRIYFEVDAGLSFPPCDVGYVGIDAGGGECRVNDDNRINNDGPGVTIRLPLMNLLGSSSPLPIAFSDHITRGRPNADVYAGFLSIMQNRLHALWIDACRKNAPWGVSAPLRGASTPLSDPLAPPGDPLDSTMDRAPVAERIFEAITGLSLGGGRAAGCRPGNPRLTWLWQLSNRARSAQGLKELLYAAFGDIPISIEENAGRWAAVSNARPLGGAARLGRNAALGARAYDRTSKFIITVGPLDRRTYMEFMPSGSSSRLINGILSVYLNEPVICEVSVTCKLGDLPRARLGGGAGRHDGGNRLGRTAVLGAGGGGGAAFFKIKA